MSIHDRKDGDWFVCDGPHGYQHRILEAGSAFDRTVCDVKLSEDARLLAIAPAMFRALCELIEKADTSDDFCYGTLATTFVRGIALNAIAGLCPSPPQPGANPMTIGDEKVVAWLLDSGGNRTYWADEETARKEYGNLCVLGYRSDTTLTSLIPHSAYAELAVELAEYVKSAQLLAVERAEFRIRAEKAESQLAELRGKVEGLASEYAAEAERHLMHAANKDWAEWVRADHSSRASELNGAAREIRTLAATDGGGRAD